MGESKGEILEGLGGYNRFNNQIAKAFSVRISDDKEMQMICLRFPHQNSVGGRKDLTISFQLDKLIGKWIKLSKYFSKIPGYHLSSLAFLQPGYNNRMEVQLVSIEYKPIIDWTASFVCQTTIGWMSRRRIFELSPPFDWIFLRLLLADDISLNPQDLTCSVKFKLVPTSNPKIYLLIFSNVLSTAKDCAKILRCFLKSPGRFDYVPDYKLDLKCNIPVEMTILYYRPAYNRVPSIVQNPDLLDLVYEEHEGHNK